MSETIASDAETKPPRRRRERLSLREWLHALWGVWVLMDQRNLGLIAAGVAFYAFLSLFPAISAVIAIWGYWSDPIVISDQMELLSEMMPEQAYELLSTQVGQLITANRSTLQWTSVISIVAAIWTTRASVAALIRGLNAVSQAPHRANLFRRVAVAVFLTTLLVLVALVAFASVVILPAALTFLGLPFHVELAVAAVKWLVLLAVVFFAIGLLYRYGPNRRRSRMRWLTPGALLALIGWGLGSWALTTYVRNFDRLNEVYGSLGAVVALLLWFYISALITLLGAQLNGELDRLRAARGK